MNSLEYAILNILTGDGDRHVSLCNHPTKCYDEKKQQQQQQTNAYNTCYTKRSRAQDHTIIDL